MAFVGLAGATITLSAMQLGWIPVPQSKQVGLVVVLVAVPLQLIACVMGFLSRDPVAATGVGTLAVSWLTVGVLTMLGAPGSRSKTLGFVLFYLAAAVFVSAVVAAVGKLVPALVLGLAAARFAVTGVYEYYGGTEWMHAAGWIGVALAAVAVYAALALELEGLRHRTILPTLRYGSARTAISGDGRTPIGAAVHEAGVRSQL
jgi:succinate-acetate transporter protein